MSILKLLDRPIAFHRIFAEISGSVSAGIFLSQAFYWSQRTHDADGWFWKTQDDWFEETYLTRYEQEGARKKLIALGILEEEKRGIPAKLFYRLNETTLEAFVQDYATKYGVFPHTGQGKNPALDGGKPANILYTENTSEITPSLDQNRSEGAIEREIEISLTPDQEPLTNKQLAALKRKEKAQIINLEFERFWEIVDFKQSKEQARRKFIASGVPVDALIQKRIEHQDWHLANKGCTTYLKRVASWLEKRGWEDEMEPTKPPTIAHSAETESKPPAPTQSELLVEAQKFIDLGWIEISYTNNIHLDLYPESKRLIAKTAWGRWIPQERWGTMLEDLARDLKKDLKNSR